jgi:hypothetical protein
LSYRYLNVLIGDYFEKRIITIKDRDQARKFKDKRLVYFKVRFELSHKFDFKDLWKFVKFFEDLDNQSEILDFTSRFEEMKLGGEERKFEIINQKAFARKKLLYLSFIQQEPNSKKIFHWLLTLFQKIEPDLFYNAYEKISKIHLNTLHKYIKEDSNSYSPFSYFTPESNDDDKISMK